MIKTFAFKVASTLAIMALVGCSSGDPNVNAVKDTFAPGNSSGSYTYKTGPLQGGTAVLVSTGAAYWVKDGTVYAANGTAKAMSPGVPYTDSSIDKSAIEAAVR